MIPLLTFKGRRGGSDLRRSQFLIVNVRQHQHRKARAGTPLRAFFSLRQDLWAELGSAPHSFYWSVLVAFPAPGEPLLEREDFGYSAWEFLLSPRDGSRKHSPPIPADDAWHCVMLSKPQLVICPVTSLRQNSAAIASGAIIAPKAIVASSSAAAGAVAAFKSSFIMFVLSGSPGAEITGIGAPQSSIKHQSILKYDNHMKDLCRLRWPRREKTRFAHSCAKPSIPC